MARSDTGTGQESGDSKLDKIGYMEVIINVVT